jgi:hypothetical protein
MTHGFTGLESLIILIRTNQRMEKWLKMRMKEVSLNWVNKSGRDLLPGLQTVLKISSGMIFFVIAGKY